MPWGTFLIALILITFLKYEGQTDFSALSDMQLFILYTSILISIIFFILSIKLNIKHNRNILLGVFILIVNLFKALSSDSSKSDVIMAILLFGLFSWFGKRLINGKKVYTNKGWTLP